jgi:hypothetical protein
MRPKRPSRKQAIQLEPADDAAETAVEEAVTMAATTVRCGIRPATVLTTAAISRMRLICEFDVDTPIG